MVMERKSVTPRYEEMLKCFTHLPQQILTLHGIDNMTEFVLHTLCDVNCLDLNKAAYFIDNPDFDCLKGVAGFNKQERHHANDSLLNNQASFNKHLDECNFNKQVRSITRPSIKRQSNDVKSFVIDIALELNIQNPVVHTWHTKHDNFGVLIFERHINEQPTHDFLQGLSLLGFCSSF